MHKSMNLGGVIVSKNILDGKAKLRWCFKQEGVNELDNGWRFLSEIDTEDFLADSNNMIVCDWGTIFEIEPAVAAIYDLPIGSDLTLEYMNGKKYFIDSASGEKLNLHI